MRGPKEKWERTVAALESIAAVVDVISQTAGRVPTALVDHMKQSVEALSDHVATAEECERD